MTQSSAIALDGSPTMPSSERKRLEARFNSYLPKLTPALADQAISIARNWGIEPGLRYLANILRDKGILRGIETLKKDAGRFNWTDEEESYLIENYQTLSSREIAKALNRTTKSVDKKAASLIAHGRLTRRRFNNPWLENEDDFLVENYERLSYSQLALKLGVHRTTRGVSNRIAVLKQRGRIPTAIVKCCHWTPDEDAILLRLKSQGLYSDEEIGRLLGRTDKAVYHRYRKLCQGGKS